MSARNQTIRQSIIDALRDSPCTAADISRDVGIREREVADHLQHIRRTLAAKGEKLVLEAPLCLACEFRFKSDPLRTPKRCPKCKAERVAQGRFWIESS